MVIDEVRGGEEGERGGEGEEGIREILDGNTYYSNEEEEEGRRKRWTTERKTGERTGLGQINSVSRGEVEGGGEGQHVPSIFITCFYMT